MNVQVANVFGARWQQVQEIAVRPDQERFIGSVSYYLAEALHGSRRYQPLALVCDGTVIGFAVHAERRPGCHWIGGFQIDARFQGKGLGRQALAALIDHCRATGSCEYVELSYDRENLAAASLYHSAGFCDTGLQEAGEALARLAVSGEATLCAA